MTGQAHQMSFPLLPAEGPRTTRRNPPESLMSRSHEEKVEQPPNPSNVDLRQKLWTSGKLSTTSDARLENIRDWQEKVYQKQIPEPRTGNSLEELYKLMQQVAAENLSVSNGGNIEHQQENDAPAPSVPLVISTPWVSMSPLLEECEESCEVIQATSDASVVASEQPIQRLIRLVNTISLEALSASVREIKSVVCMTDRMSGRAPGVRATTSEDLADMISSRWKARQSYRGDDPSRIRRMKPCFDAMPIDISIMNTYVNVSFNPVTDALESDLNSPKASVKQPRIEEKWNLLEEIRGINKLLLDSEVVICDEDMIPAAAVAVAEDGEGTILKCSFIAVSVSLNSVPLWAAGQMTLIQALWLLVPGNYPFCSPVLLDKSPEARTMLFG
ncbi:mediator of RNA polymerase II transcription subunit 15a-like [Quillaja saponaria]|uniref:Mediator of RNA polymerase II transcription subunit 15a-like n=1 Tax=Quillaja saponaria TaxID=32244 RepID=A0AAD7L0P8_QUISA|nr:mediator of RNA polymerase II transcription subunit 15a-like [Quillaja saponaria]